MSKMLRFIATLALAAGLSACAATLRNPHIVDLRDNPRIYQGQMVRIEGVVTSVWGIPMVPFSLYKVDDGTGEVTVLSDGSGTPRRGARVRVRGRVEDVAQLGGQPVGMHIRQASLAVRR